MEDVDQNHGLDNQFVDKHGVAVKGVQDKNKQKSKNVLLEQKDIAFNSDTENDKKNINLFNNNINNNNNNNNIQAKLNLVDIQVDNNNNNSIN